MGLKTYAAIAALSVMSAVGAQAAGALVIGMANGDRSQGTALGWTANYRNEGEAKYTAMVFCLNTTGIPAEVRAACRLVTTFNNQCFAVAWDPGGKPGWGWSVNADKSRAQSDALTECSARAGTTANGCKIVHSTCDVTGSGEKIAQAPSSTEPLSKVTPTPVNGAGISDGAVRAANP